MSKFRKKPIVIDATQWFKNGDHPKDACHAVTPSEGNTFLSEGKIVRYFRRPEPEYSGHIVCKHCGYTLHHHGWIDTFEGGHTVCPGDWVITGVKNEVYPCKPDIFEATYERIEQ